MNLYANNQKTTASNFDLKNKQIANLSAKAQHLNLSVAELEDIRLTSKSLPTSKNSLDLICGGGNDMGSM
ncbi:MAG: hypothetical protein KDD37_11635 [Bdellovibrionales bacterium]|nr:hypothetical protein [Bdellovibrionales bacterium]